MSTWHDLLSVALHAPSPHNVQPWKLKTVSDTEAELYIDSTRTLPKEDVTGSFIISTMGIFIEAMSVLASSRGLRIDYELLADPDSIASEFLNVREPTLIPFAILRLTKREIPEELYDEEIFLKRRTSRLHLRNEPPSPESIDSLRVVAGDWRQNFHLTLDPAKIERILRLNTEALFEDLNSPDYHDEIVEWFRYTKKQSELHRDGLDACCMNTSPLNYWLVANAPGLLLLPLVGRIMATIYRREIGAVPALGILSGQFWKGAEAIDAGRFLMRFWLETARHGLYIHPYGNLVTNRRIAKAVETELGIPNIWFVFKIGYSEEPPKSLRLPLEKILIS